MNVDEAKESPNVKACCVIEVVALLWPAVEGLNFEWSCVVCRWEGKVSGNVDGGVTFTAYGGFEALLVFAHFGVLQENLNVLLVDSLHESVVVALSVRAGVGEVAVRRVCVGLFCEMVAVIVALFIFGRDCAFVDRCVLGLRGLLLC